MLVADDWYEYEWKIKGKLDYEDEKLSWSFRAEVAITPTRTLTMWLMSACTAAISTSVSHSWNGLENANYDLRMHFLQHGGQMVRLELIAGKKMPVQGWSYTPTLDIGLVWTSPNEYSGVLRIHRVTARRWYFRPSLEF